MHSKLLVGMLVAAMAVWGLRAGAADWETDFAKASQAAGKSGQFMVLDFSGSDWCGWCMKLDREVFSKSEFKKYARKNLVCVLVDFPQQKQQSKKVKAQNAELAAKYEVRGYPTVIVLAPDGELVGRTGYKAGGAKAYVAHLKTMIDEYKQQHPGSETATPDAPVTPKAGAGKSRP